MASGIPWIIDTKPLQIKCKTRVSEHVCVCVCQNNTTIIEVMHRSGFGGGCSVPLLSLDLGLELGLWQHAPGVLRCQWSEDMG